MHTIALIAALTLAGAPGSSIRPSSIRPLPHVLLSSSRDTAVNNRTLSSIVATFNGTVTSLNWTQVVAGIDGIGAGNNIFRVAILVDEVDVCHIDVACDATAATDYVVKCAEPAFTSGQDIDVRITSMPCLGAPTGFQTADLTQR